MFRASLCPSSGERLNRTASGVSLDVLAVVVSELSALRECRYSNTYNHAFTQCTQLVSRLHTTAASTSRLTPDAALFSLSPDDGHNDARNMLS